ncbi:MAG: GNAT family N-acetyltransferase [Planctomycetes bacterium]|nr:GNAT family N-acetyltransferase [Planctomycetota bacterium]
MTGQGEPCTARGVPLETALQRAELWDAGRATSTAAWARAAVAAGEVLLGVEFLAADRPIGATVLARDTATWHSGSPGQPRLRWPAMALGYRFAPATAPECTLHRWVDALSAHFPDHRIELQRCDPDVVGDIGERARTAAGVSTWRSARVPDFATWLANLRGTHRRDLGYYRRRLLRAGAQFRSAPAEALDTCLALHRLRVADKGQQSGYLTGTAPQFLRTLARHAGPALRLTELCLDGDVVAACFALVHRDEYQCFLPAWNPAFRRFDLVRQLVYEQLREQLSAGPCTVDLLGGDLAYKRELGLTATPTVDVVVPPSRAARWREDVMRGALAVCRRMRS